jgi:hypothetical protein
MDILYCSAKGWTIPFSTTAGSVCVAKQFRTRYKGYFITKMLIEAAILFKLSLTNIETSRF